MENCANFAEVVSYDGNTGGIVGYQTTTSTKTGGISSCFNAGTVRSCGSSVGGIVGDSQYSLMADCFNAGDVYAMKEQAGGIAGSVAKNTTKGGISSCLNVGYVYGALGYNCGYICGVNYTSSSVVTELKNCYYDAQMLNTLFGASDMTFGTNSTIQRLTTAQLTNGQTLAGLEGWTYKAGSYPVPAGFSYPELTAAAATFFNVSTPQGGRIDHLLPDAVCPFNTAMPLTGTLAQGKLFRVENNGLRVRGCNDGGTDILTLSNGWYSTFYPITKMAGAGVGSLSDDLTDPVVATDYYTTEGLRVLRPEPGQTVIAISRTLSGKRVVAKQVMR